MFMLIFIKLAIRRFCSCDSRYVSRNCIKGDTAFICLGFALLFEKNTVWKNKAISNYSIERFLFSKEQRCATENKIQESVCGLYKQNSALIGLWRSVWLHFRQQSWLNPRREERMPRIGCAGCAVTISQVCGSDPYTSSPSRFLLLTLVIFGMV